PRHRHILDRTHRGDRQTGGWANRRWVDESALVRRHRRGSEKRQPTIPAAVRRLHNEDAHEFYSQFRSNRKLEQHPGKCQVEEHAYFPKQPDSKDRKATDQPPDRRQILRRFPTLWPRLGRALQSHTALPESRSETRTNRRNDLVKTGEQAKRV